MEEGIARRNISENTKEMSVLNIQVLEIWGHKGTKSLAKKK